MSKMPAAGDYHDFHEMRVMQTRKPLCQDLVGLTCDVCGHTFHRQCVRGCKPPYRGSWLCPTCSAFCVFHENERYKRTREKISVGPHCITGSQCHIACISSGNALFATLPAFLWEMPRFGQLTIPTSAQCNASQPSSVTLLALNGKAF